MAVNYKDTEKEDKEKILAISPNMPNTSGIYAFVRSEGGFKYGYVGQAKHLLTRVAQHLSGYQHIDNSIKRHGLWSEKNPCGWRVTFLEYPVDKLDEAEQKHILDMANKGYQLRNKTSGSQGEGKRGLDYQKSPKGYYDGLAQGYKNAQRFVANLFEKHLVYGKRSEKPNKNQDKALEKFEGFINGKI